LVNDPEVWSGQIYTGEKGLEKGLVDEVGSMVKVLSSKYPDASLDFPGEEKNLLQRLLA
jgi:ClpP class serine protease